MSQRSDNKPAEPGGPGNGPTRLRDRLVRQFWLAMALVFVGLGSAGVVLPLVPTTPFLLLAAYCASRSSPALHAWLYSHPRFGPLLRNWRDHRAISPRTKITGILLIAASGTWMWITVEPLSIRLTVIAFMAFGVVFLSTRPHGPAEDEKKAEADARESGQRGEDE